MALTIDQLQIQIEAESGRATSAIDALIGRLDSLSGKLNVLGSAGKKAGNGLTATANSATKAASAADKQAKSADKASKSTKSWTDKLAQQISKTRTLVGAFNSLASMVGGCFNESNDYIETLNLFNVTMGDAAGEAYAYAKAVEKAMGIDSKDFMQFQGVFKNLTAGFGVVEEDANKMSQNLTQLSYDMASIFNTDVETAFDKLSSAMSGQVKGLREFGIDTTVATLQEYALSKGIDKSVSSMSQAEKAMLRYNYIMENSTHMQGDMARTLQTPANALRVLKAQLTQAKRALGDFVSIIATQVIPYVQAAVELFTEWVSALAKHFGFNENDFKADTDGLTNSWNQAGDEVDDYSDSLKKAKKQMMGFDELNIISKPDSSSAGGDSGGGGGSGSIPLGEYDFLKGLKTDKLDEIKAKMKDILDHAYLIGVAILGWKIGGLLKDLAFAKTELTGFSKFLAGAGIVLGATLAITGLVWMIDTSIDAWKNGLGVPEFGELMASAGFTVGGATLLGLSLGKAFGWNLGKSAGKAAGLALIGTGLDLIVVSVKDLITNGPTLTNILTLLAGAVAIVVGVCLLWNAAMLANPITWIIIGIMALIAAIVLCIVYWDEIKAAAVACWDWIKGVWEGVSTWFNDKVVKPVAGFFTGLWDGFKNGAKNAWEGVKNVFSAVGGFFSNVFKTVKDKIVSVFEAGGRVFNNIKEGIVNVFTVVVNGIIKGINAVVSLPFKGLNKILDKIHGIKVAGVTPFDWLTWRAPIPEIPLLASGGIVNEGQMFVARERGPELVGSIGRKTAVANNDQIIAGIESGVYRAMVAANAGNGGGGSQTIRIINEIDGDIVGEKVIKYHNNRVMQTGASPLLV